MGALSSPATIGDTDDQMEEWSNLALSFNTRMVGLSPRFSASFIAKRACAHIENSTMPTLDSIIGLTLDSAIASVPRFLTPAKASHGGLMSTLEAVDDAPAITSSDAPIRENRLVRMAPHLLVWMLLLVPAIRFTARGWRPLSDDATIAIGAWRSLSLHPPLIGQITSAAGGANASDPGPLEYWLLAPFAHLDPGQGVLLGSAILCAVILSVTIHVLWKNVGAWATIIFSLVIADLAITSPTPFLDPVWNNAFGLFWFVAFLGIAFVIGLGNLRYFPILFFMGSVAVDSNLLYLPSVVYLFIAAAICGWFTKRPSDHRWIWWSGGVAILCWAGPLYQQFFEARPNMSLLLKSSGIIGGGKVPETEGFGFGLRALSRAASLNPIWASSRPIKPFVSTNDIAHRNELLSLVLVVLFGIAIVAWRQKRHAVVSMCVITLSVSLGTIFLFARTPVGDFAAFIWVNLAVWVLGICIWLTVALAVVIAIRPQIAAMKPQIAADKITATTSKGFHSARKEWRTSARAKRIGALVVLSVACVAGLLVLVFPYGDQFVLDWTGVARVQQMTGEIEHHVPQGPVGMGILYSGSNPFQSAEDEHGVAYLLLTQGWSPGMESPINQLLGMPIDKNSAFAVFTEQGGRLVSAQYYTHYQPLWFVKPK